MNDSNSTGESVERARVQGAPISNDANYEHLPPIRSLGLLDYANQPLPTQEFLHWLMSVDEAMHFAANMPLAPYGVPPTALESILTQALLSSDEFQNWAKSSHSSILTVERRWAGGHWELDIGYHATHSYLQAKGISRDIPMISMSWREPSQANTSFLDCLLRYLISQIVSETPSHKKELQIIQKEDLKEPGEVDLKEILRKVLIKPKDCREDETVFLSVGCLKGYEMLNKEETASFCKTLNDLVIATRAQPNVYLRLKVILIAPWHEGLFNVIEKTPETYVQITMQD